MIQYLSISEAAKDLGLTRQAVHRAIATGSMSALLRRIGGYRIFEIPSTEIARYRNENLRKPGRPRKAK